MPLLKQATWRMTDVCLAPLGDRTLCVTLHRCAPRRALVSAACRAHLCVWLQDAHKYCPCQQARCVLPALLRPVGMRRCGPAWLGLPEALAESVWQAASQVACASPSVRPASSGAWAQRADPTLRHVQRAALLLCPFAQPCPARNGLSHACVQALTSQPNEQSNSPHKQTRTGGLRAAYKLQKGHVHG